MNSLIEKVAHALHPHAFETIREFETHPAGSELHLGAQSMRRSIMKDAKNAIAAVLDHFSDPANVTDKMAKAVCDEGVDNYWRERIAAAMKAAKEELK